MPTVRRNSAPAAQEAEPVAESRYVLPTELSVPSSYLGDYTMLLYGEKKIGKTSMLSCFPEAFFMMFEPGGHGLSILQRPVESWVAARKYTTLLKENPDYAKTVIIDTTDIAYLRCMTYVCKKLHITHPSEEGYGKGWAAVSEEFVSWINDLMALNRGIIFTSHAVERTFTERGGREYNKIIPSMPNQARNAITAAIDIIAFYGYHGGERLITVQGSDTLEAGHRIKNHFLTRDLESRVHSIPAGANEEETYRNFTRAFSNRMTETYEPEYKPRFSEVKKKMTSGR